MRIGQSDQMICIFINKAYLFTHIVEVYQLAVSEEYHRSLICMQMDGYIIM